MGWEINQSHPMCLETAGCHHIRHAASSAKSARTVDRNHRSIAVETSTGGWDRVLPIFARSSVRMAGSKSQAPTQRPTTAVLNLGSGRAARPNQVQPIKSAETAVVAEAKTFNSRPGSYLTFHAQNTSGAAEAAITSCIASGKSCATLGTSLCNEISCCASLRPFGFRRLVDPSPPPQLNDEVVA
jgi:hypothetical protein